MTIKLTLPDGVTVTSTALTCSRDLTRDEWKALGQTLQQFEGSIRWWLGDWGNQVDRRYGDGKMVAMAKNCGFALHTLQNCVTVARSIENSRRREDLKYFHHEVVAPLEPDQQDYWLDLAVKEKLSGAKLKQKITEAKDVQPTEDYETYLIRLEEAVRLRPYRKPPYENLDFERHLYRSFVDHYREGRSNLPPGFKRLVDTLTATITFCRKLLDFVQRVHDQAAHDAAIKKAA
jgi:hypothetical protein